jgi:Cof subfamily protein (haloacid dehalogenase superfamily)
MLVIDIDGTLLNSKGIMTVPTYQTLLQCANSGIVLCLATARSGRIVFKPNEVPLDAGFMLRRGIYYNGATVFDHSFGFYQHTALPGEIVDALVGHISKVDSTLQIALQHDDEYHSFKHPMSAMELQPWGFAERELLPFATARCKATTKIMVYGETNFLRIEQELPHLRDSLLGVFGHLATIILADSQRAIYIVSKHTSKGTAASVLAGLHGIDSKDIAVFGDDTPDLGMFGLFGYSIAMGNGVASVKAKATYVTLSNDEDGVAYAIKSHLSL